MQIITVINAKGGCGKSTIAMGLASGLARHGHATLLIDMDPQAQVTQWLGLGDGLSPQGTLVAAMEGRQTLDELVQPTRFENLSFIASSQQLEDLGRQITDREDYATLFTGLLASLTRSFEFVVIDSPNQISPVMENAIYPSDLLLCRSSRPRRYAATPTSISSCSACGPTKTRGKARITAFCTCCRTSPARGDCGSG